MGNTRKNIIEVLPYTESWIDVFQKEVQQLQIILGIDCLAIYHVGSTAVPGLCAKPKIDIVAVARDRKRATAALKDTDYIYKGEWNVPLKGGFIKTGNPGTNLHLFFEENHPEIELNLCFRDYLRKNSAAREEYADLKRKILEDDCAQERVGKFLFPVYTIKKGEFIAKLLERTGFDRLRVLKCSREDEWKAICELRKQHFDKIGVPDFLQKDFDSDGYEHFILYRGVKIIGYAEVNICFKPYAEAYVISTLLQEYDDYFRNLLQEWCAVHEYRLSYRPVENTARG